MGELRDYQQWHHAYDDPDSGLSWRLTTVRRYLVEAFDRHPGPVRVLSLCAGDGRDVIGALAGRPDAERVSTTLVELHPGIAEDARRAARQVGLGNVEVRTADAGSTDGWLGAVPAHIVLLVGIFGNISNRDLQRTVAAAPQLCAPGATLVWSRGRDIEDLNHQVRAWFSRVGFSELDYTELQSGGRPALGCVRYDGAPTPVDPANRLFTFLR